jgi:hypothetical protein
VDSPEQQMLNFAQDGIGLELSSHSPEITMAMVKRHKNHILLVLNNTSQALSTWIS